MAGFDLDFATQSGFNLNFTAGAGGGGGSSAIGMGGMVISNMISISSNSLSSGGASPPGSSFPSSGLVRYYKLEETTGTNLVDQTSTQDATLAGTYTLGITGKINNGIDFQGTSNANIGTAIQGLSAFTISFWCKKNSAGLRDMIGQWSPNILICRNNSDQIQVYLNTSSGSVNATFFMSTTPGLTGITSDTTNFHFYVLRYDGSNIKMWLNNVESITTLSQTGTVANGDIRMARGTANGDVSLDEIGIWNRALTTDEISELWNEGNGLTYP